MEIQRKPGLDTARFKEIVYATDAVLSIKKRMHELYSSVPINLNYEICQFTKLTGDESLLDIGCGTGDFLIYLRKQNGHKGILFGADLASEVFEKNRQLSQEEVLDINFLEASILELPCKSDSFDVVTALHMLSHVPIEKACAEAKRVLKTNGKFIATANSLQSYPHVDKYRKMAFEIMGWGSPVFTSTSFNLENMSESLSKTWRSVSVKKLVGELRIPRDEFLQYFYANMLIWDPMPSEIESKDILSMVSTELGIDARDGYIVEPKYVGIALCQK